MDNLYIYEQGRAVPKEAQKSFSNGSFSGTDINPMWRIKKLTELFGPAGIGWYTEVVRERAETYGSTVMAIVDINLYIKVDGEWSKPIFGTGGNQLVMETKSGTRPSDEGYKKAYTDALSIACKALGIGADIWYSKDPTAADPTSKYYDRYQAPKQDDEPVPVDQKEIRLSRINRFCGERNISQKQFGEVRNVAAANGVIPDKRVMDLTDAEFVALMVFAEQNYG